MNFTNLTRDEFNQFVDQQPYSHFTQMGVNYDLKIAEGTETHLVGVKDENNNVIAAGLFTAVPVMKIYKYFYANRGPVMDFSNTALVTYFFNAFKKYLKRYNALHLRIDPYIPYQKLNHDGEVIERYPTETIFNTLNQLGFKHQGFTTGFHPIHQIRFHSILDTTGLTEKEVLNNMDSLRKRNIKKVIKNGIKVRDLSIDELHIFRQFMNDTSGKKEFVDRNDEFYRSRLEHFGDRVRMPLAYIDFTTYIPELMTEEQDVKAQISKAQDELIKKPDAKKWKNILTASETQLNAVQEKLTEAQKLQQEHGDTLPIAAAFYLINPFEVVYLAGGSSNEFRHFAGSYAIQWEMIKYTMTSGINRYNFYGISGDFSENAEDAGVIKFKKGFNADVLEYIGDFVLPINKPVYKLYETVKNIRQ
ncbi:aminoacyltransferase [Macrococcoides caseolyticum]|uniref:aminoacyltransferase n=1 Tax=Macrococcoides caseolyticum TaxID=69966 RepID=UPI001F1A1DC7|nr:aminoacyltransferase [Macrococcus caseolyticus]MCE4956983.1 aminoacyltransferase [Macrococcus caseolyticus]